jgi:hypothetical protein
MEQVDGSLLTSAMRLGTRVPPALKITVFAGQVIEDFFTEEYDEVATRDAAFWRLIVGDCDLMRR